MTQYRPTNRLSLKTRTQFRSSSRSEILLKFSRFPSFIDHLKKMLLCSILIFGLCLAMKGDVERKHGHKENKSRIWDPSTVLGRLDFHFSPFLEIHVDPTFRQPMSKYLRDKLVYLQK